jgi:hypothetical protein
MAILRNMSSTTMLLGNNEEIIENKQGILKGEVSCTIDLLFDWFGISCYDNWQFLFLFAKQANPNQSNRRSMVQ